MYNALAIMLLGLFCATQAAGQQADTTRALIASDTAFVIRVDGLIPENIAYNPITRGFFIGDMAHSRVLHRTPAGAIQLFAGPPVVQGAVLGMKVDSTRHLLWINTYADTARMTEAERSSMPRSTLLALDLSSGALRGRYVPADSLQPHLFNDLVITPGGQILITDSDRGSVYVLPAPGDSLQIWIQPDQPFAYPNGITLDSAQRIVYVADQRGINAIDLATRELRLVHSPVPAPLAGLDGLYVVGSQLIGIHNGYTARERVLVFRITSSGMAVDVRELERNHPAYDIPTTGAVVDGVLYYIANSQLDRIPAPGDVSRQQQRLNPVIVLRLPVPK